jgi:hypothetical protein
MLRLTGRAIDRPSRDQGGKFVRDLRTALVLQAIVRPDEAGFFPAHQFPTSESNSLSTILRAFSCAAQECPLSAEERKTSAHAEVFSV